MISLLYKVLGVSDMVGQNTYQRSEDVCYFFNYSIIEPLLDTMGLRGCLFCGFGVRHRIWGQMQKWDKVFGKCPGWLIFDTISSPVVNMSIQGCSHLVPLHPSAYFGSIFPNKILVPKLVSIAFSLRPEEALLVLTLWKLVWIYLHYIQFCFAMWITVIINQ